MLHPAQCMGQSDGRLEYGCGFRGCCRLTVVKETAPLCQNGTRCQAPVGIGKAICYKTTTLICLILVLSMQHASCSFPDPRGEFPSDCQSSLRDVGSFREPTGPSYM